MTSVKATEIVKFWSQQNIDREIMVNATPGWFWTNEVGEEWHGPYHTEQEAREAHFYAESGEL